MDITAHVTSRELSQRLKEAGVKQDSHFWWIPPIESCVDGSGAYLIEGGLWTIQDTKDDVALTSFEAISAFLSSELGDLFPDSLDISTYKEERINFPMWCCELPENNFQPHEYYTEAVTMPEAMGLMLEYIITHGIVGVPYESLVP